MHNRRRSLPTSARSSSRKASASIPATAHGSPPDSTWWRATRSPHLPKSRPHPHRPAEQGTTTSVTGRRGERFLDLVEVMDRLRSPGGCPWDAEQTHATLVKYLLEESYETAEAIEDGDVQALREELGDVLLQVVFHARIAQDDAGFDIDDVAAGIADKLVRRHPHVFAGAQANAAGDVEANWEALKAAEKGRTSAADGVPLAQPALALASALLGRAQKTGLAPAVSGVVAAPE